MKQQGFSLLSALLALVISASLMAMIVPALMRWGERVEEQRQLIYTVDDIMYSMEIALREKWAVTGCKNTPPVISLSKLIHDFELTPDINKLPWVFIPSYRTSRQFVVSLTVATPAKKMRIINVFTSTRYLTESHGNTVDIIMTLPMIESQYQHVNFNPKSQCFER